MKKSNYERITKLSTELGKYILDITKLIFGGVILTSIMDISVNKTYILGFGVLIVLIGMIIGFLFLNFGLSKYKK